MNRTAVALGLGLVVLATMPAAAAEVTVQRGVDAVLARSARAWNRADLDGFMRSYAVSPGTLFVGATGVMRGYATIRAHYAKHYGTTGMGRLTFTDVIVRPLGADYAFAVARWHLTLARGSHPTGLTSLVFHRSRTGWRIVADHSP